MPYHEQTIGATFTDNHLLEEAILEALQNNELSTYLQPIVTLKNEACETAEILLRWVTKDWPYIPPNRIVDTIYKKGFGKVFIRWLINSACQRSADLLFNHYRTILLTINISVNDLLDQDLPEMISQAIELWEIPAKNIVFEITETDLLTDESEILPALNAIKAQGCQIALDDFGTGNSSMSRLREMPVDYVKIDQMFVRNILNSKHDLEIVKQVIQLAHGLDKGVVCEGVEDIGTVELLNSLGCEKIQGYYYSKPLNFEDFIVWIEAFEKTVTLAAKMRPPAPLQMIKPITKPLNA
jgi:EAL domain-containing protein (putative c-di-GMP-specific phosphodiesterase class I)